MFLKAVINSMKRSRKSPDALLSIRLRLKYPRLHLLYRTRQSAKRRGIEVNLILRDIPEIPKRCPVFPWIKLKVQVGNGREVKYYSTPSLDRIDSKKGYVKGNVRIISWRANSLKNNGTLKELEALVKDARRNQKKVLDN
jgi:hypothetical protein